MLATFLSSSVYNAPKPVNGQQQQNEQMEISISGLPEKILKLGQKVLYYHPFFKNVLSFNLGKTK